MKLSIVILFSFLLAVNSCVTDPDLVSPEFSDGSILDNTLPIPSNIQTKLEGVYTIEEGSGNFGRQVVLKWLRGKLSIFGSFQGAYFILDGGIKNNELLFEGKWRHAISTETGLARLYIKQDSGSQELIDDSVTTSRIALAGSYGIENGDLVNNLKLIYKRPFSEEAITKKFYILAHRGGGRNSDYVGASENSLEILPYAEHFGANGVEIDVKLSKDEIPFIYHDSDINLRLTNDSPIWGPIEEFTFKQLRSFVLLKNGERIPALAEMLLYIIEETELEFVWLDMKSGKNAMRKVIHIQQQALRIAESLGRNIEILIGLPSDDKLDLFLQTDNYQNTASLCELELEDVLKANSLVWAPRWTLGTQPSKVMDIKSKGKRAFVWTLDQAQFISEFIQEGNFDGILTNYPTIVAYFHYVR